jgi:hypothetical protein
LLVRDYEFIVDSLLSSQKINKIFKSEVSFVLPSLVAPLTWQDDVIVGQTNILSNPHFHVDHGKKKERGGSSGVGGAQVRLGCFSDENHTPSSLARKRGNGRG